MQPSNRRLLTWVIVSIGFFSIQHLVTAGVVFPTRYSAQEIKAKIVDADTRSPLQGVVVLATWSDWTPNYFIIYAETPQSSCNSLINVVSAITDADGVFVIPSWKGKQGYCQYMNDYEPRLLLYKPGYVARWLANADELFYSDPTADPLYKKKLDSTSRWDGQTIKLTPLGPHRFDSAGAPGDTGLDDGIDEDVYVSNLEGYSGALSSLLIQDHPHECFWKQARPAILMLIEEERRLRPYTRYGFDLFDTAWLAESDKPGGKLGDWSCGNQKAYLDNLRAEAAKIQPDVPIWPYVVDYRPIKPQNEMPELPTMPREDWLPKGVDTQKSDGRVIYYVMLDPKNPYYAQVSQLFPVKSDLVHIKANNPYADWSILMNHNIHEYYCETYFYFDRNQARFKSLAHFKPPVQQYVCTWIVAFKPATGYNIILPGQRLTHSVYDRETKTWTLTEKVFVRQKNLTLPESVEIDSSADLIFETSLRKTGPHRWVLPPVGIPMMIKVNAKNGLR